MLLTVLRESAGPVPRDRLDLVWADAVQRQRALTGLIDDGMVEMAGETCRLAGDDLLSINPDRSDG